MHIFKRMFEFSLLPLTCYRHFIYFLKFKVEEVLRQFLTNEKGLTNDIFKKVFPLYSVYC